MKLRAAPELSNICWPFVRPLRLLGVAPAAVLAIAGTAGPPGRASAVPAAAALALVPAVVPVPAVALAVFLLAAPLAAALVPVSLAAPSVPSAPPPALCRYHPSTSILGRGPRNRCFWRASHHLADAVEKLTANLISEHVRKEQAR